MSDTIVQDCNCCETEADCINGLCNSCNSFVLEEKKKFLKELNEWFVKLMPFVTGEKDWNTGCIWVCESHPLMPYDMGYTFDCDCGAPGMSPYIHQVPSKVIERFVSQCTRSLSPDLFTSLIEEIVPALNLAVTKPKIERKEL